MRAHQRLALLETALRRLAFARTATMDADEVRRVLDMLQSCVDAERDGNGTLGTKDVQRAVHRSYARLAEGLDPARSAHGALDRAAARSAQDALAGSDLPGLPIKAGLWYATGPTRPSRAWTRVHDAALPGTRAATGAEQGVHVIGLAHPAQACYGLCIGGVAAPGTAQATPLLAVDGKARDADALTALYGKGMRFLLV